MNRKRWLFFLALLVAAAVIGREPQSSWEWLQRLLPIQGVSGHEQAVAEFIAQSLPSQVRVEHDEMHNLWFTVGRGKPHILFVAHTDELGFEVTGITPEGLLSISPRGGFLAQMYKGWPVEIHTSEGTINGLVIPRTATAIWLGVDSREEVMKLGVAIGDPVTIMKETVFLGSEFLSARGVDDRAGCAVLLAAARSIDWKKIGGRTVTFAWDVQEETGLRGASALAERLRPDVVFPVDTFVSTDSPLDPQRFARLPQGTGPVIRAIDSSGMTPRPEWRKVMEISRKRGIPIQVGNTRGGNDGSAFVPGGAVNIPLSWPGLYSHSFIERIHRRDLELLTRLVIALVSDWR